MSLRKLSLWTLTCEDSWCSCFVGKTKINKWYFIARRSPPTCPRLSPEFFHTRSHRQTVDSLSHTQKEFIVKHARLNKNRDLFLKSMIDSSNVPCSDKQITARNEFTRAIFKFLSRNAKYLQLSHGLEMTLSRNYSRDFGVTEGNFTREK